MVGSRRLLGFLFSIVLAAFSLPALADGGDKFSAVIGLTSGPDATGQITFTATIKNLARFDYLKSYTVTVPTGLTINSPTSGVSGQVVSVSGVSVAYNKTTQLTIKATPDSTLGCGSNSPAWSASAKGGLIVNNEVFTRDDTSSVLQPSFTKLCYSVTYYGNTNTGGSAPTDPSLHAPNAMVTVLGAGSLTKAYYDFANWNTVALGGGTSYSPGTNLTMPSANVALYAQWQPHPYTISVTATGLGSGKSVVLQNNGGDNLTVSANSPSQFTFATSVFNPATYAVTVLTQPAKQTCVVSSGSGTVTGNVSLSATCTDNTLQATLPSSAAGGVAFNVTVGLTPPSDTSTVVSIDPANNSCLATATGGTSTGPSAMLSITILSANVPASGLCSIGFVAANYQPSAPMNLKVLAAQVAACQPNASAPPPDGATFTASCGDASSINVSGFAAGFRGPNKLVPQCAPVNFTLTNTICGAAALDGNNNLIPPNAVSFVWDDASQTAAFTYTVTWRDEYVDPTTGLPKAGRTQYCIGTDPNAPCGVLTNPADPNRVTMQACLSPDVAFGSIPTGQKACMSEEDWAIVSQTACAALPNPNVDKTPPNNAPPACVRVTTTIIDAVDPPIIRP